MANSTLKTKLTSHLLRALLGIIMRTLRWDIQGLEHLRKHTPHGRLICSWHGELALNAFCLKKNQLFCWLMASQHQDGQIIANILDRWRFPMIRGSTQSHGALQATKTMLKLLKTPNTTIGITSDGPKGPRHQVKPGAIRIAKQCGAQILTMRAQASHYWQLNSWDKFIIPKPFCKVCVTIHVTQDFEDEHDPQCCRLINQQLNSLSKPAILAD
jgi:lysophospholipid acyltransferase (LPLAT)-like uncharacterized protein